MQALEFWLLAEARCARDRAAHPSAEKRAGARSGIAAIYNDAVVNTTAIRNEVAVDAASRAIGLEARKSQGYPVLVAGDESGMVLGYASFGDWRAWDGHRHTVEHSVYVQKDARGRGFGFDDRSN